MHNTKIPHLRNNLYSLILCICIFPCTLSNAESFFNNSKVGSTFSNETSREGQNSYNSAPYLNTDPVLQKPSDKKGYLTDAKASQLKITEKEAEFNRLMLIPVSEPKKLPKPTFTKYSPPTPVVTPEFLPGDNTNINEIAGFNKENTGSMGSELTGETTDPSMNEDLSGPNYSEKTKFDLDEEGLGQEYLGHIPINLDDFLEYFEDETGKIESVISIPFTVPNDEKLQELDTSEKDSYDSHESDTGAQSEHDTLH